ncbi:MAG: hypothetical protein HMLKMBBP_02675 [Planctomycetes bacterium]|nr:hypothetical protein [Planctomycetota bacterium]
MSIRTRMLVVAAAALLAAAPRSATALQSLQSQEFDNILGTVVTVPAEARTSAQKKAIKKINKITEKAFSGQSRSRRKCVGDMEKVRKAMGSAFDSLFGGSADDEFDNVIFGLADDADLEANLLGQDENVTGNPVLEARLTAAESAINAAFDSKGSIEERFNALQSAFRNLDKIQAALD